MLPVDSIDGAGTPGDAVDELVGWLDVEPDEDIYSVIYELDR